MPINGPVLDPAPSGRPHDYQFMRIQTAKAAGLTFDPAYKNPYARYIARTNQDARGTCTGYSAAYGAMLTYMMLTGDVPTKEEMAAGLFNQTDSLGTVWDPGYSRTEISKEAMYALGRLVGNITYPSGGEIRFVVRAWQKYGWFFEKDWHTDRKGTHVWSYPPGPRSDANGGVTFDQAAEVAKGHVIDGYAMCGTPDGGASWDEVCYAIFTKGWVYGAIPVYENYSQMQGGDGTFPDPRGDIAGYHALCFYGYDDQYLYLIHSWGDYCGQFGKISRTYFKAAQDMCVWMVVLDASETKIGEAIHRAVPITCNVPAQLTVNGTVIGISPQTIACEPGKTYSVIAAAEGYISQVRQVDDSVNAVSFTLDPVVTPQPVRSWLDVLRDLWKSLIALFTR